jgi:serine protease Do
MPYDFYLPYLTCSAKEFAMNRFASLSLCLLLGVACLPAAETQPPIDIVQQQGKAFAAIAAKVSPAVVSIQVEKVVEAPAQQMPRQHPFDEFFRRFGPPGGQPRQFRQGGEGSGFLISADGYVITNNHVVEGAENGTITVVLNDEREFEASIVGTDPGSDVAVIKIEASDLPTLSFGNSAQLQIGEWVLALGNPFGLGHTVTAGIISAKGRTTGILGAGGYENFIQTDAAINPGNSGGPLVNMAGEVIGINTAIFSRSGGSMGIGFAIPAKMAEPIYQQLRDNGSVTRGFLGVMIQDIDADMASTLGLEPGKDGILIAAVQPGTPAAEAGLASGDVILQLNEKAVEHVSTFRNAIAMIAPGTTAALQIDRSGQRLDITVTIGTRDPDLVAATSGQPEARIGLRLQALDETVLGELDIESGVQISAVEPDSAAAMAGLRPGQVIISIDRESVTDLASARKQISTVLEDQRNLLLLLHDGNGAYYVVVKP